MISIQIEVVVNSYFEYFCRECICWAITVTCYIPGDTGVGDFSYVYPAGTSTAAAAGRC